MERHRGGKAARLLAIEANDLVIDLPKRGLPQLESADPDPKAAQDAEDPGKDTAVLKPEKTGDCRSAKQYDGENRQPPKAGRRDPRQNENRPCQDEEDLGDAHERRRDPLHLDRDDSHSAVDPVAQPSV